MDIGMVNSLTTSMQTEWGTSVWKTSVWRDGHPRPDLDTCTHGAIITINRSAGPTDGWTDDATTCPSGNSSHPCSALTSRSQHLLWQSSRSPVLKGGGLRPDSAVMRRFERLGCGADLSREPRLTRLDLWPTEGWADEVTARPPCHPRRDLSGEVVQSPQR